MKAVAENKAPGAKSIRAKGKLSAGELSERELLRIREAFANPAAEEPGGVLAGASFIFPA